ncbi:hypothetical protein CR513_38568, partial [Mucuna pruriens]
MTIISLPTKIRYLLNSKAINFLICSKEIWDTLALAYECTSQVRDSKIRMLVHKYKLFKMKDNETIDLMFERFQMIINNPISLGKIYDN